MVSIRHDGVPQSDRAPAGALPRGERFGLTTAQLAIWTDQALHPRKPIYNTGQTLTIRTALDTGRLAQAISRVVEEADGLRLRFHLEGGEISQEIVASLCLSLPTEDVSAEADPRAAADAWIERHFWTPLAPTDFPLFRFALVKLAEDHFIWLQKYHHLIVDATARQLVAARVATIYNALSAGQSLPTGKAVSFRPAKVAEDSYLSSPQYNVDEAYWRFRFADLPASLIRADSGSSERLRSGRPTRLDCDLSREQSAALQALAQRHGSSVFKVILCLAWSCFSRLYGARDMVFGVPLAGRIGDEAKRTVGLYTKSLPFRLCLQSPTMLSAALRTVDEQLAKDLSHQRFPTEHINRILRLRSQGRAGLFDVGVNYVRSDYGFDIGGAPVSCANISAGFVVPWSIMALEYGRDEPIRIVMDYDPGVIRGEEAAWALRTFCGSLAAALAAGDLALGEVPAEDDPVPSAGRRGEPDAPDVRSGGEVSCQHGASDGSPPDAIAAALVEIWQESFGRTGIGLDDDFFALGGDSLKAILLISECNERFGIDLPLSIVFELRTVGRLANAIRETLQNAQVSPVVRLKESGDAEPLLLVHPVGGTLFCYRDLVSRLPADWPVYGLQSVAPGQDGRRAETVEELSGDYLRAVAALLGTGAVRLAGWSFGGLIAFEMARQLAAAGRPAISLTLIDTPCRLTGPGVEDEAEMRRAAESALDLPSGTLGPAAARLRVADAGLAGADGGRLSDQQIEGVLACIRHLRGLRGRYTPSRLVGGLTLLRAVLDPWARDEDFDWSDLVTETADVVQLPATHYSIMRPPHVDTVASVLSRVSGRRHITPS